MHMSAFTQTASPLASLQNFTGQAAAPVWQLTHFSSTTLMTGVSFFIRGHRAIGYGELASGGGLAGRSPLSTECGSRSRAGRPVSRPATPKP